MEKRDPTSADKEESRPSEKKGQNKADEKLHDEDENEEVSSSSDEEDDDLGLEGVLVRNPEVSSSSSDDDDNDDEGEKEGREEKPRPSDRKRPAVEPGSSSSKQNTKNEKTAKKKQRRSKSPKVDTIQVDFTFHDMDEKFFHGLKALLHNSSTVYQPFSSELADLMVDNISVGTLISIEGDTEHTVYGFASVLNVQTYQSSPALHYLSQICSKHCPQQYRDELQLVLSGTTKRPAGFLLHGRMINLPLEVTLALHQQLVLDMDWAVEHAEGGIEERKSLDFGAFIRIAPCQFEGSHSTRSASKASASSCLVYRFFDDEIFAGRAEFSFTVDAPKSYSKEEPQKLHIMVLTKTGHRQAMMDLEQMVGGGGSS